MRLSKHEKHTTNGKIYFHTAITQITIYWSNVRGLHTIKFSEIRAMAVGLEVCTVGKLM